MKKAFLHLAADTMQKLGIGSVLVGLFREQSEGYWLGLAFLALSCLLTAWEIKQ